MRVLPSCLPAWRIEFRSVETPSPLAQFQFINHQLIPEAKCLPRKHYQEANSDLNHLAVAGFLSHIFQNNKRKESL